MNIWVFNHYAHPPDLPGGTRHFDLGRELVRRGHKVTIFASSFHHYLHREVRLVPGEKWKIEDVEGVQFVWLRTPPYQRNDWRRVRSMVSFMLQAWRLGRKLPRLVPETEKPNVVIGSSPHLLTPLAAYWVARHYRVPFVMEVRDLWPQAIIDMGELSARHPITKALQTLEVFLYRRAERIITLGPQMREYIATRGISPEKVVWIPNGVDLSRFKNLESTSSVAGEGFKVMYLGAHGQANALDVLIQAAKAVQDRGFPEIKFVLVGDGPEKPRLMALAKALGLRNIEFRAPVPKNNVPKVLHEANVFVVTIVPAFFSYGGSFNKLSDYMAAAKPIVFAAKATRNPIEEAHCGLTVPPEDPEALAEAVIRLYRMPEEERKAMGCRGREYVEKYHAVPILADKLIQCVKGITHSTECKTVL